MGYLALGIFLCSALASRWTTLRRLGAEPRLRWMVALCLLCLVFLRLSASALDRSILAGESPAFHIHLLVILAGIVTCLALGLGWSAVVDDSRRGAPRTAIVLLFLVALIGALVGQSWMAVLALPVATRTGWSRGVAEQKHPLATLVGVAGLACVLAWPSLPHPAGPWLASGGPVGTSLFGFARVFLIVMLGALSARYILGLVFGARRIGRRLLVSHMLAGLVPVALVTLFAILITLLSLATFRAQVAVDLLRQQHALSEEMLARCVGESLEEMGTHRRGPVSHWSPELLSELAIAVGERWSSGAGWGSGGRHRPDCIHVALRSPDGGFAVLSRAAPGDSLLVPVYAWLTRPDDELGCGLVKTQGASLHVADYRLPIGGRADSSWIRIQLVERLPGGRVRFLEDRMQGRASIEELFRYRLNEQGGLDFVSGDRTREPDRDVGDEGAPLRPRSSAFTTGTAYRLMPGQEWVPASRSAAGRDSAAALSPGSAVLGEWSRIRLAVLGTATVRDLVPAIPAGGTPVEYFPIFILAAVLLVFVGVESLAFLSALRMGRSIAHAVGTLRFSTERLRQGDLSHRVAVTGEDELANLGEAFNEMAVGLEEGRRTLLEKERLESELALARQIQQRLLPTIPPDVPGLQLAGISVPAREVGGDYYDFLPLSGGRLLLVMADVSGKGAPAALLMSSVRASLHSMLDDDTELAHLAARLNKFVHSSTSPSEFVTLFVGLIDGRTGRLTYVNAGHEYPFLIRHEGRLERLTEGGLMLGAFPDIRYTEAVVHLDPGDALFLFTDGLTDAYGPEEQMFGEERCKECLRTHGSKAPEQLLHATLSSVDGFVRGAEAVDDITLLAVRRAPLS